MSEAKLVGKTVQDCLKRFPNVATRTLATKLFAENPEIFTDEKHANGRIRYYRGATGKKNLKSARKSPFLIEHGPNGLKRHNLPKGRVELKGWKPLQISGPANVLVISDLHVPFHHDKALTLAIEEGHKHDCNVILINGDFMDFHGVGHWRTDPRTIDFWGDIKTGVGVLEWLRDEFPKARIIFKEGNHDERWLNYLIDRAPVLLDVPGVSLPGLLHFEELNIEHVKDKRPVRLGKLNVVHGHEYRFLFSPVNTARGLFLRANVHALCGHMHKNSAHSEPNLEGKSISTWSVGCLCDLRPGYDPLAKWQHGAARVKVEANGAFHVHPIRIIDGKIY